MIRPARFGDIPRLAELAEEMYLRCRYRDRGALVVERFKSICLGAIRHHGKTQTTCVFVAEREGRVEGFIMGLTDWIYGIGSVKWAFDQFWYVAPGGDPRAAEGLLDAFTAWARQAPGVATIRPSCNDIIEGVDYETVARLLRMKGYAQDGMSFRMEV